MKQTIPIFMHVHGTVYVRFWAGYSLAGPFFLSAAHHK